MNCFLCFRADAGVRSLPIFYRRSCLSFLIIFQVLLLSAQYDNVVINEVSGDGGNIEAGNDGIVELAGPPGTDISCMVITNTEWAVVLPAETTIPSDGVFLIGCEERNNVSSGFYTGLNTGLSCSVCDFPGLVVDFDVCNEANIAYVSPSIYSTYGFTLDNPTCNGNKDGDQVILFQPDGTPHDAIYWGAPDQTNANGGTSTLGGASGGCGASADHVTVQINQPYTLGDNDDNGIVNDYTGPHIGFRSNGGNAVAVNIMPSGNDDLNNPEIAGMIVAMPPGDCNADAKIFTVPPLSNPIWVNGGLSLGSCNSTHIRINDTSPAGNTTQEAKSSTTASHKDDPDLNPEWMVHATSALTPSSVNPVTATEQWQLTTHPNPGQPNDADSWDFFYDIGSGPVEITEQNVQDIALCSEQAVTFSLKVYNYQHVEPTIRSANIAGSFVRDEAGVDQAWTIVTVGSAVTAGSAASNEDGVTTFMLTSNVLTAGMTHSFNLVWDDYTDCCGSSSNNTVVNQSSPHECYEKIQLNFQIAEPLTVSDTEITCPGDLPAGVGLIDVSTLVTSPNAQVTYELRAGVTPGMETSTGMVVAVNTLGFFNLDINYATPLVVVIKDLAGCGADQIIAIDTDCLAAPPCPEITGSSIDDADGNICPGDQVCFDITSFANLPTGGSIDYYWDSNSGFNPYDEEGTLLGSAAITSSGPCPTGQIYIAASDRMGTGGECGATGEYVEICHAGCDCGDEVDLAGWEIEDDASLDGSPATTINITSGVLKPGECVRIYSGYLEDGELSGNPSGDMGSPFVIDSDRNACPIWNNSGSGDGIFLFDGDSQGGGTLIDSESYPGNASGAGRITYNVPTLTCPTTTVDPFCFTFDESFCNQTANGDFYVKAIINPFSEFDDPTTLGNAGDPNDCFEEDMERFELFTLNMTCPTADLVANEITACLPDIAPSNVFMTINLGNISGGYDIVLALDDGTTITNLSLTNQTANPLMLTYADLVALLGATFDVTASIVSIKISGATGCIGTVDLDAVSLKVIAAPTGSLSAASDLLDCSGTANGSVTFEFSPPDSGPWEFEYTINGGTPIVAAASTTPFTLPVATTGTYELVSVNNVDGCTGQIDLSTQIVDAPIPLSLVGVTTVGICNDGSESVDLNEHIIITINSDNNTISGNGNSLDGITWYASDPSVLPPALRPLILVDPIVVTPSTTQEYFFIYSRPSDGCEVIGRAIIGVSNMACCTADAGDIISPINTVSDTICMGDELGPFIVSYDALDEISPGVGFQYRYLLVDEQSTILEISDLGLFDWAKLDFGTYNVYGLSYANNNPIPNVDDYLASITADDILDDISQIEMDENGLFHCLNIDGLLESGQSLVTVKDCSKLIPTLSQWGLLLFALLLLNLGSYLIVKFEKQISEF